MSSCLAQAVAAVPALAKRLRQLHLAAAAAGLEGVRTGGLRRLKLARRSL
jgi:hypothetical protein